MNKIYLLLIFLLAPVLSLLFITNYYSIKEDYGINIFLEEKFNKTDINKLNIKIENININLSELGAKMSDMQYVVEDYEKIFDVYTLQIDKSIESSRDQKFLSDDIYEQRITNVLGEPIDFYLSETSEIKIFELAELGYRGYIAKIKLFNPDVFKLALANDKVGSVEITSEAAKRTGAVLAINGGGFGVGRIDDDLVSSMIGGTVVDGKMVTNFIRKENENLFFVGINKSGDLIGTIPDSEEDILKLSPYQGASFIPILINKGVKLELPNLWENTKHPRTIIGQYANDDLILIVVDGRQGEWSTGISLERLQDKLIELGVKDAYNLDGGGSTAMYFKGEILNKPSDGSERPVANNFIVLP